MISARDARSRADLKEVLPNSTKSHRSTAMRTEISNTRPQRWILTILALPASLFASTAALAYTYETCDGSRVHWNSERATMAISTTSFPVGGTGDTQLQDAMFHWNAANSRFRFVVGRDLDATYNHSNGKNEVVFGTIADPTVLAVTAFRRHCTWDIFNGWEFGYDEADIVFDVDVNWTFNSFDYSTYPQGGVSFQSVALHELGHALGLNHENRWQATLNAYYPNGGPVGFFQEWDPLPDDRQGVRALYGGDGTSIDVGASIFKSFGSGMSGLVQPSTVAATGETVAIEYTFGNFGTSRADFDIGFYLSDNSFISTYDTQLGYNSGAWGGPGAIGTFVKTVTIPENTPPGLYYLGFVLDPYNFLAERNELNGDHAMPKPILVYERAPTITPRVQGTLGLNDWYTSTVTLSWLVEPMTPTTTLSGCETRKIASNTKGTTFTCTATNTSYSISYPVTIKRDVTRPSVNAAVTPAKNAAGWRKSPVTVTFKGTDPMSGIASCSAPVTLPMEGADQEASGYCTNNAGLVSRTAVASGIDVDLTYPGIALTTPANGAVYALNSVVTAAYVCSDALSGIASCTAPIVNGATLDTSTRRSGVAFTVTAKDSAGNITKRTVRYSVR